MKVGIIRSLCVLGLMAFSGCSEDNEGLSDLERDRALVAEKIAGAGTEGKSWKLTAITRYRISPSSAPELDEVAACELDDIYTFNKSMEYTISGGVDICPGQNPVIDEGTWQVIAPDEDDKFVLYLQSPVDVDETIFTLFGVTKVRIMDVAEHTLTLSTPVDISGPAVPISFENHYLFTLAE